MRSASCFSWSLTAQLRSSCLGVVDLQPVQAVDCRSQSTVYGSTAVLPVQYCTSGTGNHTTLPTPEESARSHPPNTYPDDVLRHCPATFPDLHSEPTIGIGTLECVASARHHAGVSANRCSPLGVGERRGILLRRNCQGVSSAAM